MSEMKPVCPMCHSDQVAIERRPNGNCHCTKCRHMWPNKASDAESALKEKDNAIKGWQMHSAELENENEKLKARIKELEALVEKMKNCDNCRHCADWDFCDECMRMDSEHLYPKWEARDE